MKVGVIGLGYTGRVHVPGWNASPNAQVVAGCDMSEAALAAWGEANEVSRLTTNADDLINADDIDIIDVCVPNMYHAPLVIAALNAGKHVLCEKPLAPTPQEIRDMIAARDASGKTLMTAQHFRFSGTAKAMKAELDSGTLGEIYHARSWMLRRATLPGRPGFVVKAHSGGGATIDIGVHILDLTLWFMGHPKPVSVSGVARTDLAKQDGAFTLWGDGSIPDEMDVEEFAAALVRFENGATLMLEVSWMLHHHSIREDMQMWLYGKQGGSHWPKCEIYTANGDTRQLYNRELLLKTDLLEPHAQECYEYAEALATGAPAPVPPEDSLQVAAILNGIYESQKTGREVILTDMPG
jgi:predicted dehydrogenase